MSAARDPTFLFVLCPPYSGSTLLWQLLCTSPRVSALPGEGQFLPELQELMRAGPWRRDQQLPWPQIRAVWESYWDMGKPLLLEKSPPNIIRAAELARHFQPARFIIMVREPLAHAEGLMRRNGWSAERAARFSAMCLGVQLENARQLQHTLVLTYEALVADPAAACRRLLDFLPELDRLDHGASFAVHSLDGTVARPITDLNARKRAALSTADRATIDAVLAGHGETLAAWGYTAGATAGA